MPELAGMHWDKGALFDGLPCAANPVRAAIVMKANLAAIAWNCLSTFENNPATFQQTKAFLGGQFAGYISIDDLRQIRNFADGCERLIELVCAGEFRLNIETACMLHNFTGREEALEWGIFRRSNVTIRGASYMPPPAKSLAGLAEKGFRYLESEIENPIERAIAAFLFMSRSQFFFDANKRTALLMMNGVLMSNGFYPLTILKKESDAFYERLPGFYETGDASEMMRFFAELPGELYPPD